MSGCAKKYLYPILIALGSSTDNFTVGLAIGLKIEHSLSCNDDITSNPFKLDNAKGSIPWHQFNMIISICNAAGAWAAGKGGLYTLSKISLYCNKMHQEGEISSSGQKGVDMDRNSSVRSLVSLLAAIAFTFLAMNEFKSCLTARYENANGSNDGLHNKSQLSFVITTKKAIQLAIPMTLNNLAGGVAGGAIGVSAEQSFIIAFIVSYFMMDTGFSLARRAKSRRNTNFLNNLDCNVISGLVFSILASSQLWDYFGLP